PQLWKDRDQVHARRARNPRIWSLLPYVHRDGGRNWHSPQAMARRLPGTRPLREEDSGRLQGRDRLALRGFLS
ncbi:unnamed protein product, partial [Ascophyllum nodosum]